MMNTQVAFQGEYGAFSEEAAKRYFGRSVATRPMRTFDDVFRAVRKGSAAYGIVPIENSLYGSIHQTYDLLQKFNVNIVGELKLRIVHALLVNHGVTMPRVKFIFSHPQALGQCEEFLNRLKHCEVVAVYDTAGAAKMIKEDRRNDAAAIASTEAGRVYGLKALKVGIESDHRNFTRFLVLSRKNIVPIGQAKTSIIFSMKNIPGALFKALSVFALRDINLYKIESRPIIGRPWQYLFYLDFQGNLNEDACSNALDHLSEITSYLKILGSYPVGKTFGERAA